MRLLTKEDLAKRWQVTPRAIDNWRKQGIIQSAKGIPSVRFTEQHILELEGVKLEKTSPLAVRRMERELEELKQENRKLRSAITKIMAEASQIYVREVE